VQAMVMIVIMISSLQRTAVIGGPREDMKMTMMMVVVVMMMMIMIMIMTTTK
jgi:hypothetical protein